MESAVTDLPEPDSPTSARVSPGAMEKLMPRTAGASPAWVAKAMWSELTSSRGGTGARISAALRNRVSGGGPGGIRTPNQGIMSPLL